ncbi:MULTISPECIES: type II toxin-antitoxin system Phd/YefM family antitoxin [Spirosoma]|uniref:type II toxin-antitoxin system Phd/YefM family antitoxin n=1 Tax=Spirosoma TaxID=107 RepID=UPI00095E9273|nr:MULTISPECIES: type II toxin-antitoxin system prevent-host-death family antitoxin [Spirosoma]MBN8821889.1 type II toxin-antitoxin system prevent-host-death family antitoxin [Spirosoma sp.]OJW80627.1 MAG: prevent-host-death protein [Spirosoma sp. 48-14]
MQVVNYTEFRRSMKAKLDQVSDDGDTIIINRSENKNVVLISLREYNSLKETLHLLGSEKNRNRLLGAVERANRGEFEQHQLIDE